MIRLMTPASEQRIFETLEAASDHIEQSGMAPTAAIAKAASALGLPPAHIPIAARAYNTARTLQQGESGSYADKSASFPLADGSEALDIVYPSDPKTAGYKIRSVSVSEDYNGPPVWLDRVRSEAKTASLTNVDLTLSPGSTYVEARLPGWERRAAESRVFARMRPLESRRIALLKSRDDLLDTVRKLASALRVPGVPSFAEVRSNLVRLEGDAGGAIMDAAAEFLPAGIKSASVGTLRPISDNGPLYSMARYAVKQAAANEKESESLVNDVKAAFADLSDDIRTAMPEQSKYASLPQQVGVGVSIGAVRDALTNLGNRFRSPVDVGPNVAKGLRLLSDPEHEQQLRSIQTQAIVQELLATDPVISSYKPYQVAHAFNDLSQLAPRAANQPSVLAPLLRRRLQLGAIDPFDNDQTVGTEQRLKALEVGQIQDPASRRPDSVVKK